VSVAWFHRHFAPVAYRGAVVVSLVVVSVTAVRALFFVGGQLRRSRSAQAVSDVKITNRIRLFFMLVALENWLFLMAPKLRGSLVGLGGMRPTLFYRLERLCA
jgi:hypothetical protein